MNEPTIIDAEFTVVGEEDTPKTAKPLSGATIFVLAIVIVQIVVQMHWPN